MSKKRQEQPDDDEGVTLAPGVTPAQKDALCRLQWRGPTPSTAPQAVMILARLTSAVSAVSAGIW